MNMKRIILTSILFSVSFCFSFSQNRVGWWKFDDATNFTKAEAGKPLTQVGTGVEKVDGPDASNGAVVVKKGTYFEVDHGIAVKEKETYVNQYSVVIDFKLPVLGVYYNFIQTDVTNTSDGDCFINKSGILGTYATGYAPEPLSPDVWYRLVVSADLGNSYKYYLNGSLVKLCDMQNKDERFSLDKKVLLFADDDGEDSDIDIAEVSLYDGALTDAQVAALGAAGQVSTGFGNSKMNKEGNIKIANPVNDFVTIICPDNQTIQNVIIYDTYGHVALQSKTSDTKINVSGLEKGIYIAKVRIDGNDYYLKCIKE